MATNITAITDTSNRSKNLGPFQFQGLFEAVIPFKANLDDDTLAAQVAGQCDITVTGAELGDFVLIAPGVDNAAQLVYAQVTASDVVTVTTFNVEGTDADTSFAGSPTFYGVVLKRGTIWGDV
jgi:hypothetical protein